MIRFSVLDIFRLHARGWAQLLELEMGIDGYGTISLTLTARGNTLQKMAHPGVSREPVVGLNTPV